MIKPSNSASQGTQDHDSKTWVEWVEYAKAIGIVLVVVGHTLRGLADTPAAVPGGGLADAWIYAFHMPLFFYLSGLFLERSCAQVGSSGGLRHFILSKARRILWPYVVWTVIQESFRSAAGVSESPLVDLWRIAFQPVMQFWFLYVLFAISALYAVWRKFGLRWPGFVITALALYFAVNLGIPLGSWGIPYQIALYAPYVAIGVLVSQSRNPFECSGRSLATLVVVASGGYAAVLAAAWTGWGGAPGAVLPVALAGIAASVALAVVLSRTSCLSWLSVLGRNSLEIFVAHTIFSAAFRQGLFVIDIRSPWVHLAGGILSGLAGPLALIWLCRRMRFRYLFGWPSRLPQHTR